MKSLPVVLLAAMLCGLSVTGHTRTLEVGAGKEYKLPSEAVAAAKNGDTIAVHPGKYFDCAIVRQSDLTIEGIGAGAVMTDKPCGGKAILVTAGNNVTIKNLTLQRVRVPDKNGAGIRAEGGNLTVIDTRFLDNENGILGSNRREAEVRVIGSEFNGNGKCEPQCAHDIYINHIALLRVERSKFAMTREGHHIKSRAFRTEVINNDLRDDQEGRSSYLIDVPNGGSLIVDGNMMQKGLKTENQAFAIMIGAEGVTQPTDEILIKNNRFTNDQNLPTTFVRNMTATPAQLIGNVFKGEVRPLEGDGTVR